MTLKNQCTPLTNRGVERTNKSAVEAVVDWVQVTFHITPISAVIEDVIGLPITSSITAEIVAFTFIIVVMNFQTLNCIIQVMMNQWAFTYS
ncbi:TPA: hypothetical protein O9L49_002728 [Staphylococcus aureus]|nr:hypothetical protein [Staphylococcus aureus]